MWWVEHGWVVSTVAKCVDTSWTGKTEQQETGRTYYPMKLLERDSSEEKTKKEQSQWQTETSERPPSPSSHQLLRGEQRKGQKSPSLLDHTTNTCTASTIWFFSKSIPKFWASQPPFPCYKFFQAKSLLFLPSTFCTWGERFWWQVSTGFLCAPISLRAQTCLDVCGMFISRKRKGFLFEMLC